MHKVFENSGWLLIDKFARLFLGLVTTAMIARHIGPEAFGIWSYALAFTTIVGGLAVLGLDKIVIKELVSHPDKQARIVSTALAMRMTAGMLSFLICAVIVIITKNRSPVYIYCTLITALNILLQSFDVLDYFYQSRNEVQQVIIPKVSVFIIFCAVKVAFIYAGASLLTFVWLSLAELFITYAVILTGYLRNYSRHFFSGISLQEARQLFANSWPLMFTGLLVLLYMKSDQLMLDAYSSPVQLGEYAAAARISELWYAIPTVIATAVLPGLIRKRKEDPPAYWQAVERWLRLSFWMSSIIAICMSFAAPMLTGMLYGWQFPRSALILSIHIWANVPVFLCVVLMQYHIVEGTYKTNLYATISGIIVNLMINVLLIPSLGGVGAAFATVASYIAVGITLIVLDKSGKVPMLIQRMLHPLLAIADSRQVFHSFKIFLNRLLLVMRKKSLAK